MFQSLALTGLGGLLAIMGTVLGQHWQAREARRVRVEAYAREDRYRLHQDRRLAYRDFHLAFGHMRALITRNTQEQEELSSELRQGRNEVWAALVPLWHIGSQDALQSANEFMREVDAIAYEGKMYDPARWRELVDNYARSVRRDLLAGTPEGRQRPYAEHPTF